jgi:hypothetical protein
MPSEAFVPPFQLSSAKQAPRRLAHSDIRVLKLVVYTWTRLICCA